MIATWGLYFRHPWWLAACVLLIPAIWLGVRSLGSLGRIRRAAAIALRCLVIALLAALLAQPTLTRTHEQVAVIAVADRSLSVPEDLQQAALDYLVEATAGMSPEDRIALVNIAEAASIARLPGPQNFTQLPRREGALSGELSDLAAGVQMALAIAPPDAATRIVLLSDGNETAGDLADAARTAASNGIPLDVLPLRYSRPREVIFTHLAAPARARSGQTVEMRMSLHSTAAASGTLMLSLNGQPVDLDPASPAVGAAIHLREGTNVKTVSLPVGTGGVHEFQARFVPDDPAMDALVANNRAAALTFVAGPGSVLVLSAPAEGQADPGAALAEALRRSDLAVRHAPAGEMPTELPGLMDLDAIVLADVDASQFTFHQQEMLARYVSDLGGGLVMIGGPHSFGAGGWIGSPLAEVLPVDLDPPQKKQMPKGALVLVVDRSGSMSGQKVQLAKAAAIGAIRLLSRRDLAGVVAFDTYHDWIAPLGELNDKDEVLSNIRTIGAGGGTDIYPALEAAYEALQDADAATRHIILLTDGMTAGDDCYPLARQIAQSNISVSTVAVGDDADRMLLANIAQATGGRYYEVRDPSRLPQIFIKEAQVVRRALIVEERFAPQRSYSLGEVLRGVDALPALDGYVLTGPKGGLTQTLLTSAQGDPVLAAGQAGLGRAVAFTSSADARWAGDWLGWGGYQRFWEQVVRWASRPGQSSDCEVFADVQGRQVTVTVEATDAAGGFMHLASLAAQVIGPDLQARELSLNQVGPGRYRGQFQAPAAGSYLMNLRYHRAGEEESARAGLVQSAVVVPFAPEFAHLSENSSLLADAARLGGGRLLGADPAAANLFSHDGLNFPKTLLPLTRWLIFAWLAAFLLDVAVRRVAIDFRAVARRLTVLLPTRRAAEARSTLDRLKVRRGALKRQLAGGDTNATRRYQPPPETVAKADDARATQPFAREAATKEPTPAEVARQSPAATAEPATHISRLLAARRRASHKDAPDTKQSPDGDQ